MLHHKLCQWTVTAFDSAIEDPRDYLKTEYGGLTLHIKPGHRDAVNLVSVFLEEPSKDGDARLTVNRFLSAMAWKEEQEFVTLGSIGSGATIADKDKPRFNYSEGRVLRYRVISRFDFEHLQDPPDQKQKLALALFREGLNSNMPFYRLLSFFKIVNIGFGKGREQVDWINANLGKVRNMWGQERLQELSGSVADVGDYLWVQGRNAIAHAYDQPIKDPDVPVDVLTANRDSELMQVLAKIFIEDELGVPSLTKIWKDHLYELAGFKRIFGDRLTGRLKGGESVPLADFPALPPLCIGLNVGLRQGLRYEALDALPFSVGGCERGVVRLKADQARQPVDLYLVLDFPGERLELVVMSLSINREHQQYRKSIEVSQLQFLTDYFSNGYLQLYDATTGERLSHKTAFIPCNIDPGRMIDGFQARIAQLQA